MLERFIAKEGTPELRVEMLLARVAADYFNFASAQGSPKVDFRGYLPWLDAWGISGANLQSDRYSDLDRQIFARLK